MHYAWMSVLQDKAGQRPWAALSHGIHPFTTT